MSSIKVVFLGTNGWYTTKTGNTTCVFVETEDSYIILDAGNGIQDIDQHISDTIKPIYLFLSHFHIDHITGMHILNKFTFPQGMTICCFKGGKAILDRFVTQPHTVAFPDLKMPVDFREMDPGRQKAFPFELECDELKHSARCFGYRFEADGKTFSYCTDTGYCDSAVKLSRDVDLLITECAYKTGQIDNDWPHLNPEEAARLANDAKAKRLALIHFDAENYTELGQRDEAQSIAAQTFSDVFAAQDGMEVEI